MFYEDLAGGRTVPGRIINRTAENLSKLRTQGETVYGPQFVLANSENRTDWRRTGVIAEAPYFGGHDALDGAMMRVSQADMYDASHNPWPNNGVWDQPNAGVAAAALIRLSPSTSAHAGKQMPNTPGGPTMLFATPPVFSYQTIPIRAVGA